MPLASLLLSCKCWNSAGQVVGSRWRANMLAAVAGSAVAVVAVVRLPRRKDRRWNCLVSLFGCPAKSDDIKRASQAMYSKSGAKNGFGDTRIPWTGWPRVV